MTISSRALRRQGFTLVEMIGVLAVIAILGSLLVPRVLAAISDARIANAAATCKSVKVAVNEYYGRYTRLGTTNGADLGLTASGQSYEDWDSRCLVPEGFADKAFSVRIGNGAVGNAAGGSRLRIISIIGNTRDQRPANNDTAIDLGAYDLDGSEATNDVTGSFVVEACIEGVDNQDALDLSERLDGLELSAPIGQNDESGRVKYLINADGTARVRIYMAHK